MKRARVIPVLLLQNKGLYKTTKFNKGKYIGDPINAVKIFNEKQCDELVFLDITASKLKKEIDFKLVSEIASECFMPLAYGGGIYNSAQIEQLLKSGVEKVVLNSVILENPKFLVEAVQNFGSSTIVASIDVKRNLLGRLNIYSHSRISVPNKPVLEFLSWIEEQNVGEVMINVVDNDGMMKGYDTNLAQRISEQLSMPIVFCGGCSSFEDIKNLLITTQVSAAAVGSYFIFHGPLKGVLISYPSPEQIGKIYTK